MHGVTYRKITIQVQNFINISISLSTYRCGLCSPVRYAAYGQTSGVAQSEMGVAVEGEPFWLDEKAGTNHSAVSMRLFPDTNLTYHIVLQFTEEITGKLCVLWKETYGMTQTMISQLGILESTERSKTENERLRNDRRDCRFTVQ